MKPHKDFTEREILKAEIALWRKTCRERGRDPDDMIVKLPSDKPNKWLDLRTGKYVIRKDRIIKKTR